MSTTENLMVDWTWAVRYVAVIVLALILAAALGHMDLFQKAVIGKLSAAHIVEFLGYGGALVIVWVLGRRATVIIQEQGGKLLALQHLILPIVSLVVVALAYSVVLLPVKPFMNPTLMNIYNWLFIALILACACWLIMAVLNKSASLTAMLTKK